MRHKHKPIDAIGQHLPLPANNLATGYQDSGEFIERAGFGTRIARWTPLATHGERAEVLRAINHVDELRFAALHYTQALDAAAHDRTDVSVLRARQCLDAALVKVGARR